MENQREKRDEREIISFVEYIKQGQEKWIKQLNSDAFR